MPGVPTLAVPIRAAVWPVAASSARMLAVEPGSTPKDKAAGSLGVCDEKLVHFVVLASIKELGAPLQVAPAATGHHARGSVNDGPWQKGNCVELDGNRQLRFECHAAEMAEESEASDVSSAGGTRIDGKSSSDVVEPHHRGNCLVSFGCARNGGLDGSGKNSDAEGFGEDDVVALAQSAVAKDLVRMHGASD